jgi:histidine triad (HIT) family protein
MEQKEECIFCVLAKSSTHKLFEDDVCYVVPDKYPSDHGHMLVISKDHHENILTSTDAVVSHMFLIAKRFGIKAKERLGATGIVIATNTGRDGGQLIFHFHIHVIPKYGKKLEGFMPHKELTEEEAMAFKEKFKS